MFATPCHPALASPQALEQDLCARLPLFHDITWTARCDSTNTALLTRARSKHQADKPWLLGTHLQERGHGRAGRVWQSHLGSALTFSCAFAVPLPAAQLPILSPLAGLVACEALHNLLGAHTKGLYLKWPNDIQWYDAKLAGVLVESTRNLGVEGGYTVVIGIGLNLYDAPALSHALGRPVADWRSVTEQTEGPACSISALVCATATAWYQALNELQENGFAAFTSRFEQVDALAGRRVHVVDQGAVLMSGIAGGIDTQGRLLLHTSAGTTPVCVGEISIRLPV